MTVYHGDSLEIIPGLEEESIDLLITDPPYNISTDFEMSRDGTDGGKYAGRDVSHDFGDWDKENLTVSDWLPLFEPVLKENSTVIIFYDYMKVGELVETMESLNWTVRQPVVWHKSNPIPQGYAVKWQEAVEMGMIATVNEGQGHNYQESEGQRHNVIETPICQGEERYEHPTQKPLSLFRPIYQWWTDEDDVILDPFCGTGSTLVTAKENGLEYIGVEKQEKWVDVSKERLERTQTQNTSEGVFDY